MLYLTNPNEFYVHLLMENSKNVKTHEFYGILYKNIKFEFVLNFLNSSI